MTSEEFRNLQHGDKINSPSDLNFIVHNNHRSGSGQVMAVRSLVIPYREASFWSITKKHRSVNMTIADGIYEVQIVRRIDNQ